MPEPKKIDTLTIRIVDCPKRKALITRAECQTCTDIRTITDKYIVCQYDPDKP